MKRSDAQNNAGHESSARQLVCIYTQNDEAFYHDLQISLSLWQREGYIQWLEISAGSNVENTMRAYLQQAHLIVLLISPDFFVQDRCYRAMQYALKEQPGRQVPVVPVLTRASAWKESFCGSLCALPTNEQPIAEWPHPEQAYEEIRAGLVRLLPGDRNFQRKLRPEMANSAADPTSIGEHKEMRKHDANAQSIIVTFNNQESKIGQQGDNFYGPITNSF